MIRRLRNLWIVCDEVRVPRWLRPLVIALLPLTNGWSSRPGSRRSHD